MRTCSNLFKVLLTGAAMMVDGIISAQEAPAAPAAPPNPETAPETVIGRNPSATFLMTEYGVSEADALKQIDIQNKVVDLADRLNRGGGSSFTDVWIEHVPAFKVVIGFADKADHASLLASLDPALREVTEIKLMPLSRDQINQALDTIIVSLNATNIPYFGGYNLPAQKFILKVESQAGLLALKAALPPLLAKDIVLAVGPIPKDQASPTGVEPGDWVAGGYTIYSTAYAESCTFSYTVTYGTKKGILTAGHCRPGGVRSAAGHWITYDTTNPVAYGYTGKYDFMAVDTTGLNQDYQIYFVNKNSIPEFPASGFLSVVGTQTYLNQKYGMVMCKQGYSTGITCGSITDGSAIRNGAKGWIAVSKTNQRDLSAPGDSGGPWFRYPGSSPDIIATGVHSGATTENCVGTGSACTAVYMPIDYIDDTASGLISQPGLTVVVRP